jgi:hypothetical protein
MTNNDDLEPRIPWHPVPSFKQYDDRWTGYHDPVTGVRLPYNPPKPLPPHDHGENRFDDRCGLCERGR